MIVDQDTNYLYLADTLLEKYIELSRNFQKLLNDANIPSAYIQGTNDIWAVDYMPIQITNSKYVQFVYNPDYLRNTKEGRKSISNVVNICKSLDIAPVHSDIILDGGNIVKSHDQVIMCDKVFKENPSYEPKKLIKSLEDLLEVDKIIFIPTEPKDFTGHADGLVRFYNDNTVLINDLSKDLSDFKMKLILALHNANLDYIEIPYNPYNNRSYDNANGIYINYLQMKGLIVLPVFQMAEDEAVYKLFQELYPKDDIYLINSNSIAYKGGILNCITWNIKL